ncbi:MAG: response regulator transcription factor [Lachnospiraceae bacterium]|nr:response regulator transcription factor [Lachnospiraceae bacterium]
MRGTILIYNNNTGIVERMQPLFAGEGYETAAVKEIADIRKKLERGEVQLLITDIELQEGDGIEAIREVRALSSIPIIVLSQRGDETSKIGALDAGADDYVVYPCNPLELVARVKSQLRRYTQLASMNANIQRIYRINELVLDDMRRKVTVQGREVRLTPIEYKILKLLVQERGRVFSIEQIYESIWHMQAIGADNTIAVHIRHIREKIETNPRQPQYLKVVWGTGYKVG